MSQSIDRNRFTVLVVDDTDANRYVVVRWLTHAGFKTLETRSGEAALELADGADAVVLDVNLPDLHGFDVGRVLRERHSTKPIIYVSAVYVTDTYKAATELAGGDAYFTAPIDPAALVEKLDDLLGA